MGYSPLDCKELDTTEQLTLLSLMISFIIPIFETLKTQSYNVGQTQNQDNTDENIYSQQLLNDEPDFR